MIDFSGISVNVKNTLVRAILRLMHRTEWSNFFPHLPGVYRLYLNTFTYTFPVVQVTIFIVPHSATGNVNSLTLLCRQHSLARQVEFALQPRRPQTSPTRVDTALQTVVFCGVPYLPTTHLHLLIPPPPSPSVPLPHHLYFPRSIVCRITTHSYKLSKCSGLQ